MNAIHIIVLVVAAIACAALAIRLAASRGRSRPFWALFTIAVGVLLYVAEEHLYVRADGDAATLAGFDMQSLLPIAGMLGAAFVITQLPSRRDNS